MQKYVVQEGFLLQEAPMKSLEQKEALVKFAKKVAKKTKGQAIKKMEVRLMTPEEYAKQVKQGRIVRYGLLAVATLASVAAGLYAFSKKGKDAKAPTNRPNMTGSTMKHPKAASTRSYAQQRTVRNRPVQSKKNTRKYHREDVLLAVAEAGEAGAEVKYAVLVVTLDNGQELKFSFARGPREVASIGRELIAEVKRQKAMLSK